MIGETLLCFAVERSQQCLKGKASSGKKKQKERLQASLILTSRNAPHCGEERCVRSDDPNNGCEGD